MTKDTILAVLRRRAQHLRLAQPNHLSMAHHGLSYGARQLAIEEQQREQEENAKELEVLTKVISILSESPTEVFE